MPTAAEGGLGSSLVGDKIMINSRHVQVTKLLGEGGFSYVYMVKEISDALGATVHGGESAQHRGSATGASGRSSLTNGRRSGGSGSGATTDKDKERPPMVLKVTSILSRQQRDIAEKEAKLLSRLSHPSIIKMYDTCYRSVANAGSSRGRGKADAKERPQHLILMEFCEGGHALEVCTRMAASGTCFDLATLIIAFGQICNAVSYLHAQRPPIVHRDLKPANFLVKNGAYKLCDFGSAVFGHVDLKTQPARMEAEEVIQKTTTQMFRAPEMVDLYMAKKLTQATDVWALGCCLYSLAFLQNCFEEGSNLAILSRKYKIPDDNPYGEGLVELIDRMLTIDTKERADMTEVILCLSAVYSGRELPPRRERKKEKKDKEEPKKNESAGTFRTDAQGVYGEDLEIDPKVIQKQFPSSQSSKPLKSDSAAARRRAAAQASGTSDLDFTSLHTKLDAPIVPTRSSTKDPFGGDPFADGGFAPFDHAPESGDMNWSNQESPVKFDAFASFSPDAKDAQFTEGNAVDEGDDNDDEEYACKEDDGSRRRRNSTGRKSREARSLENDHNGSCDEGGRSVTPTKKPVLRRTRSGGRKKPGRGDSNEELELMRAATGSGESKEEEDEDDKASRQRTPTNRLRRSQTSAEAAKPASQSARSSGTSSSSSSRRDSRPKSSSSPHKDRDSSSRPTKDSSARPRSCTTSGDPDHSTKPMKDASSRTRSLTGGTDG